MRRAGLPNGVKNLRGIFGVAKHFIAKLAGIAGAADHHRGAMKIAKPPDRQAEPRQFLHRWLMRRRPDDVF